MKTPAIDQPDQQPPSPDVSQHETFPSFVSDAEGMPVAVRRLETGARVYSADGVEVAGVEMVRATSSIGVRAGSPGRAVDLPLSDIQREGEDGRRLDVRLTGADIERLAGADALGYAHLAAQQPDNLGRRDKLTREGQLDQA